MVEINYFCTLNRLLGRLESVIKTIIVEASGPLKVNTACSTLLTLAPREPRSFVKAIHASIFLSLQINFPFIYSILPQMTYTS